MHPSNNVVSIVKPFSPPTLCMPDPANVINVGDNAVVVMQSGERITGKLHSTEMTNEYMLLDTKDSAEPVKVIFNNTKLISLHNFKLWVDFKQEGTDLIPIAPPKELDFCISFKDGDELLGKSLGFYTDSNGYYLYPTQKPRHFIYTFIPHCVIENSQIGPKIGEILIEENLVATEHVNSALNEQDAIRKKQIGDYLKSQALVTTKDLELALKKQNNIPNIKLGEYLLNESLITQEQLDLALETQKNDRNTPLGQILIKQGKLTTEQVQGSLAKKMGIQFVDLDQINPDIEALSLITESVARKYKFLPLHIFNNKLIVVVNDPLDWKSLEFIRFSANMDVIPVMASAEDIKLAIDNNYTMIMDDSVFNMTDYDEADNEVYEYEDSEEVDHIVVRLAKKIIIDAYNMNVSDVHIEPYHGDRQTIIRMRKAGALIPYHSISPRLRHSLVSRFKVMARLDISEKRLPQDGKIDFRKFSKLPIELRIATIPTAGGEEDVVIRILTGKKPMPVDGLQLSKDNLECTKYVLNNPYGLFFVCGPTGSGKTTTLHSLVNHLNSPDRKIWTVEDPVEFTQEGLRQVQVQPKIGLDFTTILRSFLRCDPDIIMVGEMRDNETAKICINASLTGHLVLSTIHTNSAVDSIIRLLEMGLDPFNFSDALLGILSQRLAKRLCPECKQVHAGNETEVNKLLTEYCYDFERVSANKCKDSQPAILREIWQKNYCDDAGNLNIYKANGCKTCDESGYLDRLGLHEMMMADNQISLAISRNATAQELLKIALDAGMRTLPQDGIEKILQGYTDIQQVRKYSIRL